MSALRDARLQSLPRVDGGFCQLLTTKGNDVSEERLESWLEHDTTWLPFFMAHHGLHMTRARAMHHWLHSTLDYSAF